MSDNVIPPVTRLAAKRAFIRTAAQTLSSVIPIGGLTIALTEDFLIGAALGVGGAVLSSLLAGIAAALQIIAKGIPEEYVAAAEASGR